MPLHSRTRNAFRTPQYAAAALAVTLLCAFTAQPPRFTTARWEAVRDRLQTGIAQPLRSMEAVQSFVNRIPYKSDLENYGLLDYWAPPREFFERGSGDCEDYVIAKYALGLENHLFRPEEARIVIAFDRRRHNDVHMLLVVRDRVYDSQTAHSYALSSAYTRRYLMVGIVDTAAPRIRTASLR